MCANLNQEVQTISTEKQVGINLEFFGISSGLDEIVQASSIRKHLTAAWGNKLLYNGKNEEIYFPTSIISFTDKTRYLFQMSKGMIGDNYSGKPFEVNKKLEPEAYAVPFNRWRSMIKSSGNGGCEHGRFRKRTVCRTSHQPITGRIPTSILYLSWQSNGLPPALLSKTGRCT